MADGFQTWDALGLDLDDATLSTICVMKMLDKLHVLSFTRDVEPYLVSIPYTSNDTMLQHLQSLMHTSPSSGGMSTRPQLIHHTLRDRLR